MIYYQPAHSWYASPDSMDKMLGSSELLLQLFPTTGQPGQSENFASQWQTLYIYNARLFIDQYVPSKEFPDSNLTQVASPSLILLHL